MYWQITPPLAHIGTHPKAGAAPLSPLDGRPSVSRALPIQAVTIHDEQR